MNDWQKSAEYQRKAVFCLEVAQRMSVNEDRERMTEMAQRWLELAQQAKAAEQAEALGQRQQVSDQPLLPQPEQGQQPALQQEQVQPKDEEDK